MDEARPRRVAAALAAAVVVTLAGCQGASGGGGSTPPEPRGTTGATVEGPPAPATAASAEPTASARPTAAAADAPRAFTVVTSGDMLIHHALQQRAEALEPGPRHDFTGMLARVAPAVDAADLAVCAQETPLSPDDTGLTDRPGTFVFNAPFELADAMAGAGYDACTTASNHTLDQGLAGVAATRQVLGERGIQPIGPVPAADEEPGHPVLLDAGTATLGVVTYTFDVRNTRRGSATVPGMEWMDRHLFKGRGAAGIIADARRARQAGADVVMVAMHWGNEYQQRPTDTQRAIAREVLASGEVDVIAGSHTHVVQPCETFDGHTVAYGMGNFLSEQGPNRYPAKPIDTQDGVLLRWTFTPTEGPSGTTWAQRLEYQPTFVTRPDFVIDLATPEHLPASYARTVSAMTALGPGACDARPMPPGDGAR